MYKACLGLVLGPCVSVKLLTIIWYCFIQPNATNIKKKLVA